MSYSRLVQQFWEHNEKEPLGAVAAALYLFLLEIWEQNGENDFKLSDTEICERLKITRPTIITLRPKLTSMGMIQYQPKNGVPGNYKILMEYPLGLSNFEKTETDKGGSTNKRSKKSIPAKKKIVGKSSQKSETPQNQNLSSDDSEENPVTIPIPLSRNIPSRDEFAQYAESLDSYVPELYHRINEKYNSWLRDGWRNGYGKPITDWKSTLRNIIPFLQVIFKPDIATPKNISLQNIGRPKSANTE